MDQRQLWQRQSPALMAQGRIEWHVLFGLYCESCDHWGKAGSPETGCGPGG
jgi:hypothetical protein